MKVLRSETISGSPAYQFPLFYESVEVLNASLLCLSRIVDSKSQPSFILNEN